MCYSHTLCPYLSLNNYIITILNNGLTFNFFFQAEDGIRDHCVTGAQTCALPICKRTGIEIGKPSGTLVHVEHDWMRANVDRYALDGGGLVVAPVELKNRSAYQLDDWEDGVPDRSEERRVGKEWRSWWAAQRSKMK